MYTTVGDVRATIKDDALNSVIGNEYIDDESVRLTRIDEIIEAAILDADGEIDGYLNKRYRVPLRNPSKVICKFSKDIALYNIFSRQGIQKDSPENTYYQRYRDAIRFLENVAKGIVEIGVTDDEGVASSPIKEYRVNSDRRIFSRDSLRGM